MRTNTARSVSPWLDPETKLDSIVREIGSSSGTGADRVRWMQQSLNRILGLKLAEDGIMGTQTRSAIRSFQQTRGLAVDGVAGPRTVAALNAALTGATQPASTGDVKCHVLDDFLFDAASMPVKHMPTIRQIANRIVESQRTAQPTTSIRIEGHTDPKGTEAYNLDLGRRRAEDVRGHLVRAVETIRPGLAGRLTFIVESRGESHPIAVEPRRNRRVEVSLRRARRSLDRDSDALVLIPNRFGYIWSGRFFRSSSNSFSSKSGTIAGPGVIPPDSRQRVRGTLAVPFRFICSLVTEFGEDPDMPGAPIRAFGTGTLISPRHVLTAGHNVLRMFQGRKGSFALRGAERVTVLPARNGGSARHPYGSVPRLEATGDWRVPPEWRKQPGLARGFDFALITLKSAIPSNWGFWGTESTIVQAVEPSALIGLPINTSGYPEEKIESKPIGSDASEEDWERTCSTQWRSSGKVEGCEQEKVEECDPRTFANDLDGTSGQSGSPIWLVSKGNGIRIMAGIFTRAIHDKTETGKLYYTGVNGGVRITSDLLETLSGWMKADDVSSTVEKGTLLVKAR